MKSNPYSLHLYAICYCFAILNGEFIAPQSITIENLNCLSTEVGVQDDIFLSFDLTLNSYSSSSYIHIFDIGESCIFLRYSRYNGERNYYIGVEAQRFSAVNREFDSPADDGVPVHQEISITQTRIVWTMDNVVILDEPKESHSLLNNQQMCFANNNDYRTGNGKVENFKMTGEVIPIEHLNCLPNDISIADQLSIKFDVTLNSYLSSSFIHIFDIGESYIFLRYSRYEGARNYYVGIENQRFSAVNRIFDSPSDDGITVHHEIFITQNRIVWTMDNECILDEPKAANSLLTNQQMCFANNNDFRTGNGDVLNVEISSSINLISDQVINQCVDTTQKQPFCYNQYSINKNENVNINDDSLLSTTTALKSNIFFFSIRSKNTAFDGNGDFISINFFPYKEINYSSYLQILFDFTVNQIILYRVNPSIETNNKYELERENVQIQSANDYWLEFSNNNDLINGYIKLGVGATNIDENILISIPFYNFVEISPNIASYRLSYESFKYIAVSFYNYDNVINDGNSISLILYDACKDIDELSAYINAFGFVSTDSGTEGNVMLGVYVKNDVYLCTVYNVDANEKTLCTNLVYEKYNRCKYDKYRELMYEYDYVFEITAQNNDYLTFDRLLLDDLTILLDKDMLLTNVDTASINKAVIAFNDPIDSNQLTVNGVIIETVASSWNTSPIFGLEFIQIPTSQILMEMYTDNTKIICNFFPSLISNNNDNLCVNNMNDYTIEANVNYIAYSTISCIDEEFDDKLKITIDSDDTVEINKIFINNNSLNKFCSETTAVYWGTTCSGTVVQNTESVDCRYLTECITVGMPSDNYQYRKPIAIFDLSHLSLSEHLQLTDYNTLYTLSITTCNDTSLSTKISVLLKGILGSAPRTILSGLTSKGSKTYYIGAMDIGTFYSIQFEIDNTDICINHVELKDTYNAQTIFSTTHHEIGKGIVLRQECSYNYILLETNIFIPCYEKSFILEKYGSRLHTQLTMKLCAGDDSVGVITSQQSSLGVVLSGMDINHIYQSTNLINLLSNTDWNRDSSIRQYNILTDDYDIKSLSVVYITNDQLNPVCIDKVIINKQEAILNSFWIGSTDCVGFSCIPTVPAVLSWPICNVEIIDSRITLKSKESGQGEVFSASCTNSNRFTNIGCSAEKVYGYEISKEWNNEISNTRSSSFTFSETEETTKNVESKFESETMFKFNAGVVSGEQKFTVGVSGGKSWTDSTTSETTTGTEISVSSTQSYARSESTEIHCASSIELGPYQQINYDIIKDISISEYQTETDFKLTKCSYILDQDATNPDHFIYLMGIPGKITTQESISCSITFYEINYIQSSYKCNEAQKINAIELNTYVPFCNDNDHEKWDSCQCETGDKLTDQTCYCVDPSTGLITDDTKATATDNSVTTWKTWCSQNCLNTKFKNDSKIVDQNGDPVTQIINAQNDHQLIFEHYFENNNYVIYMQFIIIAFLLMVIIAITVYCFNTFKLSKKHKYQPIVYDDSIHQTE